MIFAFGENDASRRQFLPVIAHLRNTAITRRSRFLVWRKSRFKIQQTQILDRL
jgi:hypothetical protein